MTTNREVRSFLNHISKKKYGKSYGSLGYERAKKVRLQALRRIRIGR